MLTCCFFWGFFLIILLFTLDKHEHLCYYLIARRSEGDIKPFIQQSLPRYWRRVSEVPLASGDYKQHFSRCFANGERSDLSDLSFFASNLREILALNARNARWTLAFSSHGHGAYTRNQTKRAFCIIALVKI